MCPEETGTTMVDYSLFSDLLLGGPRWWGGLLSQAWLRHRSPPCPTTPELATPIQRMIAFSQWLPL